MDSIAYLGYSAMGSRTKRLSDYCFEQVRLIYEALSICFEPTFYPYISHIHRFEGATIADLSKGLGVSHSAASKMVKKLEAGKLILLKSDPSDKRSKKLYLTPNGKEKFAAIQPVCKALNTVMGKIDRPVQGLLAVTELYEQAFAEESLRRKVLRELMQTLPLQIKDYHSSYQAFYEMHNRIWIERNFTLEPMDIEHLGDPETHVLAKGGRIYIYCLGDYPMGGFSLLEDGNGIFQLSKMYVPEALHGYGIGNKMLPASIEQARKNGCRLLYLVSNTKQKAAIHLYRKTGFVEVPVTPEKQALFKRVNIQMEMQLSA